MPEEMNKRVSCGDREVNIFYWIDSFVVSELRIQDFLLQIEQQLLTIRGLGIKTAAIFLGELGNPQWFQKTKQVVA